jgi:hypothetical protein
VGQVSLGEVERTFSNPQIFNPSALVSGQLSLQSGSTMLSPASRCGRQLGQSLRSRSRAPLLSHRRNLNNITVGIVKETTDGETRVAMVPDNVKTLVGKGASVQVERGAGVLSGYPDSAYEAHGATVVDSVWESSTLMVKVNAPDDSEVTHLNPALPPAGRRLPPHCTTAITRDTHTIRARLH